MTMTQAETAAILDFVKNEKFYIVCHAITNMYIHKNHVITGRRFWKHGHLCVKSKMAAVRPF